MFTGLVEERGRVVGRDGARRPGDRVNLEVDVMAKYAERLLDAQRGRP